MYSHYNRLGDSNEKIKYPIFNINRKSPYLKSAAMGFFPGTQERIRNSRGKRVIRVRATDGLLAHILVVSA